VGIDLHPWAVSEARWTYHHFGFRGLVRRAHVLRFPTPRQGDAVIASYVLNELSEDTRAALERNLLTGAQRGARILVLEPIARAITPWWDQTARRFVEAGGRTDEWRLPAELPSSLRMLGRAAGLRLRELTMRSLYCSGSLSRGEVVAGT
jgi:hypothetical protein